ncbi:hypothetical protein KA531_00440 [Candidatus Saccharibacteria bacterium]|nr:hypothetical protein [Candidatus Saccharibacteria bacterium]
MSDVTTGQVLGVSTVLGGAGAAVTSLGGNGSVLGDSVTSGVGVLPNTGVAIGILIAVGVGLVLALLTVTRLRTKSSAK